MWGRRRRSTDPGVVPLRLELGDLLLALQKLLATPVQLLGQHRKLLEGHQGAPAQGSGLGTTDTNTTTTDPRKNYKEEPQKKQNYRGTTEEGPPGGGGALRGNLAVILRGVAL